MLRLVCDKRGACGKGRRGWWLVSAGAGERRGWWLVAGERRGWWLDDRRGW